MRIKNGTRGLFSSRGATSAAWGRPVLPFGDQQGILRPVTAKSLLAKHGFEAIKNQDIHKITSMRLENSGNTSLAVVGSQLSEMRGLRNKADYQLEDPKTEVRATAVFWNNKAKEHSDLLEKTFGGPEMTNVIAAIRKWEQLT